jgi:hypothetical protein
VGIEWVLRGLLVAVHIVVAVSSRTSRVVVVLITGAVVSDAEQHGCEREGFLVVVVSRA